MKIKDRLILSSLKGGVNGGWSLFIILTPISLSLGFGLVDSVYFSEISHIFLYGFWGLIQWFFAFVFLSSLKMFLSNKEAELNGRSSKRLFVAKTNLEKNITSLRNGVYNLSFCFFMCLCVFLLMLNIEDGFISKYYSEIVPMLSLKSVSVQSLLLLYLLYLFFFSYILPFLLSLCVVILFFKWLNYKRSMGVYLKDINRNIKLYSISKKGDNIGVFEQAGFAFNGIRSLMIRDFFSVDDLYLKRGEVFYKLTDYCKSSYSKDWLGFSFVFVELSCDIEEISDKTNGLDCLFFNRSPRGKLTLKKALVCLDGFMLVDKCSRPYLVFDKKESESNHEEKEIVFTWMVYDNLYR